MSNPQKENDLLLEIQKLKFFFQLSIFFILILLFTSLTLLVFQIHLWEEFVLQIKLEIQNLKLEETIEATPQEVVSVKSNIVHYSRSISSFVQKIGEVAFSTIKTTTFSILTFLESWK